jgi:hypothetical protein
VIGLYQEPGWETVTVLFLTETTDSLFLRLRPSHGQAGSYPKVRVADQPGVDRSPTPSPPVLFPPLAGL